MKLLKSLLAAALVAGMCSPAYALNPCEIQPYKLQATLEAAAPKNCTIGYAHDSDLYFVRANDAWVGLSTLASITGDNGGTIVNSTDTEWTFTETSEDFTWDLASDSLTLKSSTSVDDLTTAFDLVLSGGAGVLTLIDSASSIVLNDNDTTALVAGSTGLLNLLTLDTGDNAETVIVTGTTAVTALHLDTGLALFDELVSIGGGAGAITLTGSAASVLVGDNDTTALDIGSAGATTALRYSSADDLETFTFNAGVGHAAVEITGITTLDASDCGKPLFVTAAADGDLITLPALTAVPAGCKLTFHYVGADGGALIDITPNASDGIEGGCTLAASVVTFSGTDDADIGLTKATILTGDTITLTSGNADDWYASAIQGICANN